MVGEVMDLTTAGRVWFEDGESTEAGRDVPDYAMGWYFESNDGPSGPHETYGEAVRAYKQAQKEGQS